MFTNNCKMKLEYHYESIDFGSCISVLSLNTHNLEMHLEDVLNDYGLMQSDILCLQETYLKHSLLIEKFKLFNCIPNFSKNGLMICVKKHIVILETMHFGEDNVELQQQK